MELDEMKQAWQMLDRRLAAQQAIQWQGFRAGRLTQLQRRLRPLAGWLVLQIPLGVALMAWGIASWGSHLGDARAMAPGLVMHAFGLLSVMIPARTLAMLRRIDYASPVLEIQCRLARLRAWRVRVEGPVSAVIGSVIWIPALLMLAQADADRFGMNLWDHARPGLLAWLVLSALVSLSLVGLGYMVLRRLGKLDWLANHLAGASLRQAQAELEALLRFERENG
ncbi:hypothetical protein [Dyella sp.]|uniref:hypothetical protein n=1 Tax=Dyella sp. TaxID=1869338 RepID=UPI002D78A978|nr:hypothetical protein [Dyella sp.]HET6433716.1 hypothetical protein [Dyella sp.]